MEVYSVLIVLTGLISSSAAKLSCQSCTKISKLAGDLLTGDESIQGQLFLFKDSVCAEVAEKFNYTECSSEMEDVWPLIAKAIFNSEEGWFKTSTFCSEYCSEDQSEEDEGTGTTYCEDCVDYMDAVPKYTYDDSIIIGDVVYALQYEGFCQQFEDSTEDCREKVAHTFPRIMRVLKSAPLHEAHVDFCENSVECVSFS
ncbi:uncharacterized protein LOC111701786 [Eurytemora carolleeae]|uniref:uncharacterized protein LOC111701786 n=1 Tax=Eurytemora carolleeae TaxID=1294199 RepID=UPI000C763C37|nr:uncharacterized protein LOC111701786 [Eurytemora carolleeae]|eukprot:XP_023328976.1 uncharacterized protein LOC111701786 [Eurytemora affinis]